MMTGLILAVARAAGEVAPLMILGMVKLASLPVDGHSPYVHLDGKFMHRNAPGCVGCAAVSPCRRWSMSR